MDSTPIKCNPVSSRKGVDVVECKIRSDISEMGAAAISIGVKLSKSFSRLSSMGKEGRTVVWQTSFGVQIREGN